MAFILKDRVKENSTTTGTGNISLGGASATFDTFQSYLTNGDTTFYAIAHTSSGVDEWEVGLGTWNTGNTLSRTTVLAGSNGTSAVDFSAGTKDIFMTYPASKAIVSGEDAAFANITVTGTVDGRDIAADGTKLDGVEASADVTDTANVTSAGALMRSGGTMTGNLVLNANPSAALGAATKQYVDTEVSSLVDSAPSTLDTLNELAAALGDDANFSTTVTNSIATKLPLAGGTMTGNLNMGDTVKATFGAGSDLEIFHWSNNASYIQEKNATGSLFIEGADVYIRSYSEGDNMIVAQKDGAVTLYYDNAAKIATSSTGVDITGAVTVGTYQGSTINAPLNLKSDANHHGLSIEENSGTETWQLGVDVDGDLNFHNSGTATPSVTFSDSGNVGIGTDSPNNYSANHRSITLNAPTTPLIDLEVNGTRTGSFIADSTKVDLNAVTSVPIRFLTADTERMRLDSSGNLLVGTTDSTPIGSGGTAITSDGRIDISRNGGLAAQFERRTSDGNVVAFIKDGSTVGSIGTIGGDTITIGSGDTGLLMNQTNNEIIPWNTSTNAANSGAIDLGDASHKFKDLHLSGTGYVGTSLGIGTSSPSQKLHVDSGTTDTVALFESSGDANAYLVVKDSGSSGGAFFGAAGTDTIIGTGGSTERMRINSEGNVGLFGDGGVQTIDHYSNYTTLTLSNSTGGIIQFEDDGALIGEIFNGASHLTIGSTVSGASLRFRSDASSEAMRLDSSGKLLIGNSTSQTTDLLQVESPASGGGHGIAIRRNDNNADQQLGRIMFGNVVDSDIGQIDVKTDGATNSGAMRFSTASSGTTSEHMRITSAGDLLVSKTSVNSGVVGVEAKANGTLIATVNGDTVSILNRLTSNGELLRFQKDGSTVGSIGATGGRLYIGDDTVALRIVGDADEITPWNATANTNRDAAIALGNSTNRFTDLHLSGAVNAATGTYTGNTSINGTLTVGTSSTRNPIKIYSNSWPEVQMFKGTTEELRIGAADSSGTYNTSQGDFYIYDPTGNSMRLIVPIGASGSITRNNGAITVWDSGNDGSGSGLDADLLDGVHASGFVRGDGTNQSAVDIRADNTDFIVRDTGDSITNFIWRDHSANTLYLGTANAVITARSTINANSNNITNVNQLNGGTPWTSANDGSGSGLDADTVDGKQATDLLHYRGVVSGDWDNIFTTGTGKTNTSGLYQINNHQSGHSNYPSGSYSYGGVFAWQLTNSTFKLYAPHTGTLWYQTGWSNDEYSGWRKIWDSGNDGSGSGLDADLLDGVHGSSFLRSDADDSATGFIDFTTGSRLGNLNVGGVNSSNTSYNRTIQPEDNANLYLNYDGGGVVITNNSNSSGYLQDNQSVRAPIFYDSNNTNYYLNPANSSATHIITTNWLGVGTTANSSGSDRLTMGGNIDMNNYEINYVHQLHFQDGVRFLDEGNDQYLRYRWNNTGGGGIQFYDGNDLRHGYVYGDGSGGFGLLDKDAAWFIYTNGTDQTQIRANDNIELYVYTSYVYAPGSFRAPIFYDSNDTAYYVDPNSESRMARLHVGDGSNYIRIGDEGEGANTSYSRIRTDSSGNLYLDAKGSQNIFLGWWSSPASRVYSEMGAQFPVYYDRNNTAYYADLAGTSVFNQINATTLNTTSDIRFKSDLQKIDNAVDKLKTISGYTYMLKDHEDRKAGLIAQEVEAVLPEAIKGSEDKKLLDYHATIALLVEAVKEQSEQIAILKSRLTKLEN